MPDKLIVTRKRVRVLIALIRALALYGLAVRPAWAAAGWNCQQDANSKEWVCVTGKKQEANEAPSAAGVDTPEKAPVAATDEAVRIHRTAPEAVRVRVEPSESVYPSGKQAKSGKPLVDEEARIPASRQPAAAAAEPLPPLPEPAPVSATAGSEPLPPLPEPAPAPTTAAVELLPPLSEPVSTPTPARGNAVPPPRQQEAPMETANAPPADFKPEPLPPLFEPPPIVAQPAPAAPAVSARRAEPAIAYNFKHLPGNRAPENKTDPLRVSQNKDEVEVPGWACQPDPATREWVCDLRGADPSGAAHAVGAPGDEPIEYWVQSNDITDQDELRLSKLLKKLPADPWELSCRRPRTQYTPATVFAVTPEDLLLRERSPLEIDADKVELVQSELSNFWGNADMSRADQRLYADFVSYNNKTANLNAQGNVFYREKGTAFASTTGFMRMNSDQSVLRNAQYILETVPARGVARIAHIDSKTQQRYENVAITGCPVGNQDWVAHADSAHIDKEANEAELRNAWLEFKGVPFAWTPYYSFPLDDRRKSGLLAPAIGYSKMNGFGYIQPYYFNLAPNFDMTLAFREQTSRGQAGRGQFRYLTEYAQGLVEGEVMPYDKQASSEGLPSATRWVVNANNTSRFTENLSSQAQIFRVSDQQYFRDFGNYLTLATSTSYARSFGNLTYADSGFSVSGMADTYQQINSYLAPGQQTAPGQINTSATPGALYTVPYSRVPQVLFNTTHALGDTGLTLSSTSEVVNFMNNSQLQLTGSTQTVPVATGNRLNIRPTLSYSYSTPALYVKPKLALQYTQYWLTNAENWQIGNPVSVNRFAPIFSVDNGMFFDREFELGDSSLQQTLEPRLFYLYIPRINQTNIPIFDTQSYDVNYWQLFRDNRFVGTDRLADSNQFTLALTSRLIDQETGFNRLTLKIGQTYYLEQQTVQMNSPQQVLYASAKRKYSNVIGEVSSQINSDWTVGTTVQWDPSPSTPTVVCAPSTNGGALYPGQNLSIPRVQAGLRYNNRRNDLLNIGYLYLGNPNCGSQLQTNQSDISFRLPLFDNWHLLGEWAYALNYNTTAQTYIGFDKENCCWRFSVLYWKYLNGTQSTTTTTTVNGFVTTNTALPQSNWSVFVNITFKGLTELDTGLDNFLFQRMPGFRRESDL